MIYPSTTGKADGKDLRLRTMESVWLQGKLKMWGRWATYSDMPEAVNMFKRMLSRGKITHDDLVKAMRKLRKAGISNIELEQWMLQMQEESVVSSLVFCSNEEGALMDKVIGTTLINTPGLLSIIKQRYLGRGKKQSEIARDLNDYHPEWSYSTCQRRVSAWLNAGEYALYLPLNDAFNLDSKRFSLQVDLKTG
ncbi:DUF1133 family protein [Pantoea stewartii]|uniref:DUF1133 family protein n=1 Tax=Pantoea stewartii TaxID=66269 RepID=UPI0023F9B00A|nr:DUF1133 family protein [Pantoea stewartii]MDF7787808.1 DUF1133 family protein [Pantoea stewartii]